MATTQMQLLVQASDGERTLRIPSLPVIHIGAAGGCELLIPCRSRHVATLISRGARWFLLNRSQSAVVCGQSSIAAGRQAEWVAGSAVMIEGVRLTLQQCKPAGRSVRLDLPEVPDEVRPVSIAESAVSANEERPPKQLGALLTIAVCVVLCAVQIMHLRQAGEVERMEQIRGQWQTQVAEIRRLSSDMETAPEVRERMSFLHQQLVRIHLAVASNGRLPSRLLIKDTLLFCRSLSGASSCLEETRVCRNASSLLAAIQ